MSYDFIVIEVMGNGNLSYTDSELDFQAHYSSSTVALVELFMTIRGRFNNNLNIDYLNIGNYISENIVELHIDELQEKFSVTLEDNLKCVFTAPYNEKLTKLFYSMGYDVLIDNGELIVEYSAKDEQEALRFLLQIIFIYYYMSS